MEIRDELMQGVILIISLKQNIMLGTLVFNQDNIKELIIYLLYIYIYYIYYKYKKTLLTSQESFTLN